METTIYGTVFPETEIIESISFGGKTYSVVELYLGERGNPPRGFMLDDGTYVVADSIGGKWVHGGRAPGLPEIVEITW